MTGNLNKKKIKRLLIINRGEIALRVMSTCRDLGIETVSIFTEKEKDLPHAKSGDININLGSGETRETYLNIERLIQICRDYHIDAVHPGYGFLSENADFADRTEKEGIIFIGPTSDSIRLMGDKRGSKERLKSVDVPLIPGYHGSDQSSSVLMKEAKKIGYPVLIKASAGGGGKGMRIVSSESEFKASLDGAKREALNAFGDDSVLIEKFIQKPRHIEIQVLSDIHGNHFHLFDRECSIQRRYQKIIEEAPSPSLLESTREQMTRAAVNITRAINYRGAGTIEFILDDSDPQKQNFYFLEMNTRLQVEHPVTEMITGVDLVAEQIGIAEGEKISFLQEQIMPRGHSIEARIYAEDPDNEFLPTGGKIAYVGNVEALSKGVRLDCGYENGNQVSMDFDPMIAKVISFGLNRKQAVDKLNNALNQLPFLGIKTNRYFLKNILAHSAFLEGKTYTDFIATHKTQLSSISEEELTDTEIGMLIAAYEWAGKPTSYDRDDAQNDSVKKSSWSDFVGFRNV